MEVCNELKLDEFFSLWLTDINNIPLLNAISSAADDLELGKKVNFDFSLFDHVNDRHAQPQQPVLPRVSTVPTLSHLNIELTPLDVKPKIAPMGSMISKFYDKKISENELKAVKALEDSTSITSDNLGQFLKKICRLPSCFAPHLIIHHSLTPQNFRKFYTTHLVGNDPNERFFKLMVGNERKNIIPSDLTPFVQSLVESHSSLQFLKGETVFQEKFIDFIITRTFYIMDVELRGTADLQQIRKMNLAGIFFNAENMNDINESQHIFNYQHFYVAFCKFWDLDNDSDGLVTKDDLLKFNDSAISPIIVERFFKASFYPRSSNKKQSIDFTSFVYYFISCEDKTSPTAINFWFRLADLDDDGVLSMREIEKLYESQYERMRITGNELIPFDDIFRQLLDMVHTSDSGQITPQCLLKSKMSDVFFNSLFDMQKFLIREYQFPAVSQGLDETTKNLTPWEIYVIIEYEQLVNDGS